MSCPILGRKEHSFSGVFILMLVCFLLHSCFLEMAGRSVARVSLSCCLVGLFLLPFLSTQCIFRQVGEASRRNPGGKILGLISTALLPLDVNMLGLAFSSYFWTCETRNFPDTPQPPQYLQKDQTPELWVWMAGEYAHCRDILPCFESRCVQYLRESQCYARLGRDLWRLP